MTPVCPPRARAAPDAPSPCPERAQPVPGACPPQARAPVPAVRAQPGRGTLENSLSPKPEQEHLDAPPWPGHVRRPLLGLVTGDSPYTAKPWAAKGTHLYLRYRRPPGDVHAALRHRPIRLQRASTELAMPAALRRPSASLRVP